MAPLLRLVDRVQAHLEPAWQLAFSPDGSLLACCSTDKSVSLYSISQKNTLRRIGTLQDAHQRTIRAVEFSPHATKNPLLASASFDATVNLWFSTGTEATAMDDIDFNGNDTDDASNGELFECGATLEGHENEVKSVAFSPIAPLLATCSRDKSVWIWNLESTNMDDCDAECLAVLQEHTQDVKCVRWCPDREWLLSAGYDDTIRVWCEDVEAGGDEWICRQVLTRHASTVWYLDFCRVPSDTNTHSSGWTYRLLSVSDDLSLKVWNLDMTTGKFECTQTLLNLHSRPIYSITSNAKSQVLTCGGDNSITLLTWTWNSAMQDWELAVTARIEQATGETGTDVNCVRWHPTNDSMFVSVGDDGAISVWEVREDEAESGPLVGVA